MLHAVGLTVEDMSKPQVCREVGSRDLSSTVIDGFTDRYLTCLVGGSVLNRCTFQLNVQPFLRKSVQLSPRDLAKSSISFQSLTILIARALQESQGRLQGGRVGRTYVQYHWSQV